MLAMHVVNHTATLAYFANVSQLGVMVLVVEEGKSNQLVGDFLFVVQSRLTSSLLASVALWSRL